MTEAEWLSCTDPRPMLRSLLGTNYPRIQAIETFPDCKSSDRKLRLFACACYYRIWHLLPDIRAKSAVKVAEQFAEGVMSEDERRQAEANVRQPLDAVEERWRASKGAERISLLPTHEALALAEVILWDQAQKAGYYAASNASHTIAALANPGAASSDRGFSARVAEERAQTDVLRCIFANPFRPVPAVAPSWLAWNNGAIVTLARDIYDERAFDRMPALGEALRAAGCDDEEVLRHCEQRSGHVKGCWLVDLLLGKE